MSSKTTPEKKVQTGSNERNIDLKPAPENKDHTKSMVFKTTPEKKDLARHHDQESNSKTTLETRDQIKPNDPRISSKTTPDKKDHPKPHNQRSPRKEQYLRIKTKPKRSCSTVINPTAQMPSTSAFPYSTMISVPYTRPVPVITTISPYTTPIFSGYSYLAPSWPPMSMPMPSPVYSLPSSALPNTMIAGPLSPHQVCPYTIISNTRIPVSNYSLPSTYPLNNPSYRYQRVFSYQRSSENRPYKCYQNYEMSSVVQTVEKYPIQNTSDLGSYLRLPKQLFPKPRMLALDPNPVIHELCLEEDIDAHLSWILDVEFGSPGVPATRPIAIYDVQYNSIQYENSPGAMHPAFENTNQDFKRLLLFYYDYIISSWYKGYVTMNQDISVVNFQSWLQTPMQNFGMCWP